VISRSGRRHVNRDSDKDDEGTHVTGCDNEIWFDMRMEAGRGGLVYIDACSSEALSKLLCGDCL
jgi:hypothetical protein